MTKTDIAILMKKTYGLFKCAYALTAGQMHVLALFRDALVCRTDDAAAFKVELLIAVCAPAYDTGHCEQRGIELTRDADAVIDES